jgi:hypothetical protein
MVVFLQICQAYSFAVRKVPQKGKSSYTDGTTSYIKKTQPEAYFPLLSLGLSSRVGSLPKTPGNLNPERMLGGFLPHRTETRNNGRARCDEETARPLVKKAGCETNGERDPSPGAGATIRSVQGHRICHMASLWSARRPFMMASPNPHRNKCSRTGPCAPLWTSPDGTTLSPAAPQPVDHYLCCANCPWHTSTHEFLQKWPPGRRRDPPYPIVCTCYSEAKCGDLTNNK